MRRAPGRAPPVSRPARRSGSQSRPVHRLGPGRAPRGRGADGGASEEGGARLGGWGQGRDRGEGGAVAGPGPRVLRRTVGWVGARVQGCHSTISIRFLFSFSVVCSRLHCCLCWAVVRTPLVLLQGESPTVRRSFDPSGGSAPASARGSGLPLSPFPSVFLFSSSLAPDPRGGGMGRHCNSLLGLKLCNLFLLHLNGQYQSDNTPSHQPGWLE